MAKSQRAPAPFPTREQIIEFVRDRGSKVGKREIARAFQLNTEQKTLLRDMLKDLEAEGTLTRGRGRGYIPPGQLPSVGVIEITDIDTDGETLARPYGWKDGVPPKIFVAPDTRSRAAYAPGDRVLARLRRSGSHAYEARVIRRLSAPPRRTLGVIGLVGGQVRILPVDRRARDEFVVQEGAAFDAQPGDLVWAEVQTGRPMGLKRARVIEKLGPTMGPKSISLITLHDHDIPSRFNEEAVRLAEQAGPVPVSDREDLRSLPLVTIDGADARDFDDAVWAESDPSPSNPGGWHIIVAIADVAWYVRPNSALDRAAFERGNSVYFPDRVVPMLPEPLSNGWCSLKPSEDRPCLAAHLWIDAEGTLLRHQFQRSVMRSAARLTYTEVEEARGALLPDATDADLASIIRPLYGAYESLARARKQRGVLELDVRERRVIIGEDGAIARVEQRERFDSHKLIEEFMILANVAAAETLETRNLPCVYRIHDKPSEDKLASLREFLATLGLKLPKTSVVRPKDMNRILERVAGTPESELVNAVVLRSQAQAQYHPDNIGHFGLSLKRYCHFTSPIRRYADLLVHRALIDALKLGEGGLLGRAVDFERAAEHISGTERRAAAAERDALDRFTAAYLAERRDSVFEGRISGVTRFGLFVQLDETGADGLVPMRSLPDDYYIHDEHAHQLVGRSHGLTFRLGDQVEVRLVEANALTGGVILELLGCKSAPNGRRRTSSRPAPRRQKSQQLRRRR
ncbi:MAG: ribonuclease R [Hyphomicrobiales bacterium]|nr:ribonuclease R [Hyphomicrobiales bacterium]